MEETNKSIAWKIWRKGHPYIWPTFHELNTWQSCKNAPNPNVPLCSIYIPSHLIFDIFIQFFSLKNLPSPIPNEPYHWEMVKNAIGNDHKILIHSPLYLGSHPPGAQNSQIPPRWDGTIFVLGSRNPKPYPPWESWENPTQYIPLISHHHHTILMQEHPGLTWNFTKPGWIMGFQLITNPQLVMIIAGFLVTIKSIKILTRKNPCIYMYLPTVIVDFQSVINWWVPDFWLPSTGSPAAITKHLLAPLPPGSWASHAARRAWRLRWAPGWRQRRRRCVGERTLGKVPVEDVLHMATFGTFGMGG